MSKDLSISPDTACDAGEAQLLRIAALEAELEATRAKLERTYYAAITIALEMGSAFPEQRQPIATYLENIAPTLAYPGSRLARDVATTLRGNGMPQASSWLLG